MGRPYSDDLRERVLKEAERSSARRAAVRFGIGAATAVRWAARARLGERSAQPGGGRRDSRLDAHAEFVETMIRDRKDITLDEMVERRATERDLHLSRSALSAWLRRQGWTFGPPSRRRGRALCFLPPDSPDFNPIENAFAKLKALLRARAERTVDALWRAVGDIVPVFTPAECTNCFHAAGYDAT